jgi:hypothetical protein
MLSVASKSMVNSATRVDFQRQFVPQYCFLMVEFAAATETFESVDFGRKCRRRGGNRTMKM